MKETNMKANDPALVELAQLRSRLQNAEDKLEDLVEKLQKDLIKLKIKKTKKNKTRFNVS